MQYGRVVHDTVPDVDLELKDIWPVSDGTAAFAIAESPTRGVKLLEWHKSPSPTDDDDAAVPNAWQYIDDKYAERARTRQVC